MIPYLNNLQEERSREHQLALLFILLVGIALRLYASILGEGLRLFAINDEVSAYQYALAFLAGESQSIYLAQPLLASGQLPGPFWTLLWVSLLKLGGGSPEGAIIGMAMVNSVVIYLVYRLAIRMFRPHLALFCALFFALGAWPVYYAHGLWNPLPLALLGGLLFINLWDTLTIPQSARVFWVALFAALTPQFHMIGVFYIPVILLMLMVSSNPLHIKWLWGGIAAGFLLYIPYLWGELATGFANTRLYLGEESQFSWGILKILTSPASLLSSVPAEWAGKSTAEIKQFGDAILGHYSLLVFFSLITLVNALILVYFLAKRYLSALLRFRNRTQSEKRGVQRTLFLGTLLFLPLILFILTGKSYTSRYAIILFPLLFLLPAYFMVEVLNKKFNKVIQGVLGFTLIFNLFLLLSYYPYHSQAIAHSETFLPSFNKMEMIRSELDRKSVHNGPIEWSFSESIEHLPEINRKTTKLLQIYFNIHDQYLDPHQSDMTTSHYRIFLASDEIPSKGIELYRDNSIAIFNMPNSL